MNNVNIIGRVSSDIIKKYVNNIDKYVVHFSIAVDDRTRQTDGQKFTHFFEVEAWDLVASRIYDNCKKGDRIAITGHLEQDKYTNKKGDKVSIVKIVVSTCEYLSPKSEKKDEPEEKPAEEEQVVKDDDLPF